MTEPLLEVTGLAGGYKDVQALWGLDLTATAGTVTTIFGRNGAGKTTLLSTIAGLLPAKAGRISFGGRDVTAVPAHARSRAGIALVQENKRIFHKRTVEQNLMLGGHLLGRRDIPEAIEVAYSRFPILATKRRDAAGALSGGQQQMLAIAQALMPSPRLLMLDEPSTGLAPSIVSEVLDVVVALKEAGLAIVLVEQLVGRAMSVADHVTVLDQGRVAGSFDPSDAHGADFLRETYLR